jgi:predicted transcriptional regulator of viral defense system
MSRTPTIPTEVLQSSQRVLRPRDLGDVYSNPAAELARLASRGVLLRLAHGYYALPPLEWMGNRDWRPAIEAVALGVAQADHGRDATTLAGITAARLLEVVPRALSVGVVAVPVRRRPLPTAAGTVHFWSRPTSALDLQAVRTELASGWTTTTCQTLLDLADHPRRANVSPATASEAIWALATRCDWSRLRTLAQKQGRMPAYRRARWAAEGVDADLPPPERGGRPVSTRGLRPLRSADPARFGVNDDR